MAVFLDIKKLVDQKVKWQIKAIPQVKSKAQRLQNGAK